MDLKILQDTPPWDWPRDAGKRFQRILKDRRADPSDRLIAADLAGDLTVMNDEIAGSLLAIAGSQDEPEDLRARSAIALGAVLEQSFIDEFDEPEDAPIQECTFHKIQNSFERLYSDSGVPKEVRRRILEASVRAPADWHRAAIADAYASQDREWMLTAVVAMRYVRGFDNRILNALENPDPEIHYEAVKAASNWELDGAWSHVVALVEDASTPQPLLLAAIGAVAGIRPIEAREILEDLIDSDDEEIAEAADEAIMMAESSLEGADFDDEEEEGEEEDEEEEEDQSDWIN